MTCYIGPPDVWETEREPYVPSLKSATAVQSKVYN